MNRYARDLGRQQAAELRKGGVEMLCRPAADTAEQEVKCCAILMMGYTQAGFH